jgi:hypothetical protein
MNALLPPIHWDSATALTSAAMHYFRARLYNKVIPYNCSVMASVAAWAGIAVLDVAVHWASAAL